MNSMMTTYRSRVELVPDYVLQYYVSKLKSLLAEGKFDRDFFIDTLLVCAASSYYGLMKDICFLVSNVLGNEFYEFVNGKSFDYYESDKVMYAVIRKLLFGEENPLLDKYLYENYKNENDYEKKMRYLRWFVTLATKSYEDVAYAILEKMRCEISDEWKSMFFKGNYVPDLGFLSESIGKIPYIRMEKDGIFGCEEFLIVKSKNKVLIYDGVKYRVYVDYKLVFEGNENIYMLLKKYEFDVSISQKIRAVLVSLIKGVVRCKNESVENSVL